MKPSEISPQDRETFRREMKGVRRREYAENYTPPVAPRRPAVARKKHASRPDNARARVDNTHGADLEFCWDDLSASAWRQLKAGQYTPDEVLDLHGRTEMEAQRDLADFLRCAAARGARCVGIIHGKGLRSEFGGVLKPCTAHYLKNCAAVQAFCSAQPKDGGGGAVYALLRTG